MWRLFKIAPLFFLFGLYAQVNTVHAVYFEFDKYSLMDSQIKTIINLINSPELSNFEALELYGYCDDRGTEDYNDKLSNNRVATVQNILLLNGISQKKIIIKDGRGRVLIDKDTVENLEKTRDKNRRVEIIFIKNTTYSTIPPNPKVGDLIVLNQVVFDMGSSALTLKAKRELDRIFEILKNHKTIRFEIKGHVCCTSSKYSDAIDEETQNRHLSVNRAKKVFNYLRSKGISPYRMTYKGYGNLFPLRKEVEFDRRVEFLITKT